MEVAHLVHHEDGESRSRQDAVLPESSSGREYEIPRDSERTRRAVFSSIHGPSLHTSTAYHASESTQFTAPLEQKSRKVTLPSIHNLVQGSESLATAPPPSHQEPASPPSLHDPRQLKSRLRCPPNGQLPLPSEPASTSGVSVGGPAAVPSMVTAADRSSTNDISQPGFPRSSHNPLRISDGSARQRRLDGNQRTNSPIIPSATPIHIPMNSPPTHATSALPQSRSNSLDDSGSGPIPRKGSSSSTAPSLPSPDLARVGSAPRWQHHHYITSPAPGAFTNQLTERYTCATCNKPFSRPSSLRIHSHSHTGEKPFRCPHPDCGKSFSVRSNMKRHERGCHGGSQSSARKS